jgi:transposase-like protein
VKKKNIAYQRREFFMKRKKIASDVKFKYVKLCLEGKLSFGEAARMLGVHHSTVSNWVLMYKAQGEAALLDTGKMNVYPEELKLQAVHSYLNGEGSYRLLAARYGLRSVVQIKHWVMMYNNGEDFLHKRSGGSRMNTLRNTTKEERIQIVKECIANNCNYGETAKKHNVSYQQVYGWVNRFKELGESGLEDRRGKRKVDQEPRSELEKLQIENERLKQELYMIKMERDLIKKVKELERKDLYRK